MTRFLDKSFSTFAPGDDSYRENWEATFGKKRTSDAPAAFAGERCEHGFVRSLGTCGACPNFGRASGDAQPDYCTVGGINIGTCPLGTKGCNQGHVGRRERDQPCQKTTSPESSSASGSATASVSGTSTERGAAPNARVTVQGDGPANCMHSAQDWYLGCSECDGAERRAAPSSGKEKPTTRCDGCGLRAAVYCESCSGSGT